MKVLLARLTLELLLAVVNIDTPIETELVFQPTENFTITEILP